MKTPDEYRAELLKRLRDEGFQHEFVFFGHGWGHCKVCHGRFEVQYPSDRDKICRGPLRGFTEEECGLCDLANHPEKMEEHMREQARKAGITLPEQSE